MDNPAIHIETYDISSSASLEERIFASESTNRTVKFQNFITSEPITHIVFKDLDPEFIYKIGSEMDLNFGGSFSIEGKVDSGRSERKGFNKEKLEFLKYFKSEFKRLALDDHIETGFMSKSCKFTRETFTKNPEDTEEALNQIFLENFGVTQIALAILDTISNFPWDETSSRIQTIALAGLTHENPEVNEFAIRAFEQWEAPECLTFLSSVKPELLPTWLKEYLLSVQEDLGLITDGIPA
ncbi:MAG: hypothetical protein ACFHHU_04555 [Porticoccaceae bacterium]